MSDRTHTSPRPGPIPAEVWARAHKSGDLPPTTWYAGRVEGDASEIGSTPAERNIAAMRVTTGQLNAMLDGKRLPHPAQTRVRAMWRAARRQLDAVRRIRVGRAPRRTV